eukprot:scaffold32185_cov45-Attheya_sp.AAC.3
MTKNRKGVNSCQGGLSCRKSMRPAITAAFHYYLYVGSFAVTQFASAASFVPIQRWPTPVVYQRTLTTTPRQQAGFLDDLLGGIFGDENNDDNDKKQQTKQIIETKNDDSASSRMSEMMLQNRQEEEEEPSVGESEEEDEFRTGSLQGELDRRNNNNNLESPSTSVVRTEEEDEEEFDGYAMRDVIYEKWGECFDVDFQRVDAFGVSELYMDLTQYFSRINTGTNTWGRTIILSYYA